MDRMEMVIDSMLKSGKVIEVCNEWGMFGEVNMCVLVSINLDLDDSDNSIVENMLIEKEVKKEIWERIIKDELIKFVYNDKNVMLWYMKEEEDVSCEDIEKMEDMMDDDSINVNDKFFDKWKERYYKWINNWSECEEFVDGLFSNYWIDKEKGKDVIGIG